MALKMGTVIIENYNSNWKTEFDEEKVKLKEIFRDIVIAIEHVGSTSIEGMSAKPIIDIAIGIEKLSDFEKIRDKFINNQQYSLREENSQGEILIRKGNAEFITHFIHVMEFKSERYQNMIAFREHLRKNLEDKKEYEKLKKNCLKNIKIIESCIHLVKVNLYRGC